MNFIPSITIYICNNDNRYMRNLTNKELDFVTRCPIILNEVVERPKRKHIITKSERLNNAFAEVSTEILGYRISNDDKLRKIHEIVNSFKGEKPAFIKEVVKSYYPKMTKHDISLIVDNALSI